MATITQDMRYRLSLIKYAEKFGVTKAAVKYKTNRQYIYRWKNAGMTAPLNLSVTVPADPTTIPTSIPRKRSNSSTTCAGAIQMPVWLFSGSNSCSADIPAPFPVYTGFCVGRA